MLLIIHLPAVTMMSLRMLPIVIFSKHMMNALWEANCDNENTLSLLSCLFVEFELTFLFHKQLH